MGCQLVSIPVKPPIFDANKDAEKYSICCKKQNYITFTNHMPLYYTTVAGTSRL